MSKKSSSTLPTFRRQASKFRFNRDRDDHAMRVDMVKVFCPSPLLNGTDGNVGIYGAPCVVLQGYEVVTSSDKVCSVVPSSAKHVVGRMVELHPEEVARLDQVAEHAGAYHRFLAEVVGPTSGTRFSVWVYQRLDHATSVELATSATELPAPSTAHQKLLTR